MGTSLSLKAVKGPGKAAGMFYSFGKKENIPQAVLKEIQQVVEKADPAVKTWRKQTPR